MEFLLYTAAIVVRGELLEQVTSESKTQLKKQIFNNLINHFSDDHPSIQRLRRLNSIDYLFEDNDNYHDSCLNDLKGFLYNRQINIEIQMNETLVKVQDGLPEIIESDLI